MGKQRSLLHHCKIEDCSAEKNHSFCSSYTDDSKKLSVRINASYNPPSSFSFAPPSYRAASALTLSCLVQGLDSSSEIVTYRWSSTCSGNCFTQRADTVTATVSTPYLHSYDTGIHTCTAYDLLGRTGNASITVDVVGETKVRLAIYKKIGRIVSLIFCMQFNYKLCSTYIVCLILLQVLESTSRLET